MSAVISRFLQIDAFLFFSVFFLLFFFKVCWLLIDGSEKCNH